MGDLEDDMYGDLENDDELEAELLALQGGTEKKPQRGKKRKVAF